MARNRKPKARRESARKKKLYILEHQRQLAEQERKQYLLTIDAENRTQIRSLEQTSPANGLRALFGVMMRRVFNYAPSPIPDCDIEYFRFGTGDNCTDNYAEMLLRWHQAKLLEKLG